MCRTTDPGAERDKPIDNPTDIWVLITERRLQPRSEIQIPIDVGELAYTTENRSDRHINSTPEGSTTFLVLEGGSMSQERPTSNPNSEHPGGFIHVLPSTLQPAELTPHFPVEEANAVPPIRNRYWRLFNDPGLTPPAPGLTPPPPNLMPPVMTTEAFLGFTQQVQTVGRRFLIFDQLSEGTTSLINQRLDDVQRDFVKSKEEVEETTKGGSPFVPEIQDKPVPSGFRLPTLKPYDGSTDPLENVATFRAQMALYDTSDALMCHAFLTTLRGSARMWYSRLKSSSISSFDHFAKEFELNFMSSSHPRPKTTSLLDLTQGSDEPLAQFVSRFATEVRRMPNTHPSLECNNLKNQIEDLIHQGHLHRFVRDQRALEERPRQERDPSPRPDRPVEKQIDVIVGGPTFGGDSSSARKAYARSVVEKRPRNSYDPEITFGARSEVYPDHNDAPVISAQIANARVKRIMVDTRRLESEKSEAILGCPGSAI
ncbi:hypothetical protein B296_00038442 [Ensete ventricosum]|uniref:Retrotransposon gag domain-containing protein n=1 Tax=Ensete ventricosum TaxID=4639 RepID=A0A426Z308_ENSVE|nr:hypothetical protein B296_00038442 [Ensete ventricosum]